MVLPPGFKQAIYTSGVQWDMVSVGMALAYPATLLPELQRPDSDIQVDQSMASWLASMPGVAGIIPTVLLGPVMHYAGRKTANICLTVPLIIGWVLTYFAAETKSISMLLAGRFLQGLCIGALYFISVCVGEFSAPKIRSYLLSMKPLAAILGVTLTHCLGLVLDWKNLALVGALPPALALLTTVFWPDTPDWLVSRGRYEEARGTFYSLRGVSEEGKREIEQMIETEKTRRSHSKLKHKCNTLRKLKSPVLWKPVGVLVFAVLVPVTGGRQFIASYSLHLAAQISGDQSMGHFYTVLGDVIAVAAAFINLYLVRVCTRRRLLLATGFLGFALLVVLSAMLYLRTSDSSELLTRCILGVFALYIILANAGFYPVSFMLMGEILPLEYRAVGSVVDGVLTSLGMTVVVGIMPWLESELGTHGMLLFYGSLMFLCLVYLYFELPETRNRTLHDVGNHFRGKSPKIKRRHDIEFNVEENNSILG